MTDSWHPVRFAVALLVLLAAIGALIGLVALPFLLRWTGYRARDTAMFLIPLYNWWLLVVVVWRVSASRVYWSQRPDLPSRVLIPGRGEPETFSAGPSPSA